MPESLLGEELVVSKENILIFYCAEGAKKALQRMGMLDFTLNENVKLFELPCSGRVNEVLLLSSLEAGYDKVLIIGCHKDNCRYISGNLRAEKKANRVRTLIQDAGIKSKIVKMIFTAPDEANKLKGKIDNFINNNNGQKGEGHVS